MNVTSIITLVDLVAAADEAVLPDMRRYREEWGAHFC